MIMINVNIIISIVIIIISIKCVNENKERCIINRFRIYIRFPYRDETKPVSIVEDLSRNEECLAAHVQSLCNLSNAQKEKPVSLTAQEGE